MDTKKPGPNNEKSEEILQFLDSINIPRLSGSNGDKIAQEKIQTYFRKIPRSNISTQSFTTSFTYINGVLIYFYVILGFLTVLTAVSIWFQQYQLGLGLGIINFVLSGFHKKIVWQLRLRAPSWGKPITTQNIIAEIPSKEKHENTIVFLAHYDSISHSMSPILEGLSYMMGYIVGCVFRFYSVFRIIGILYLHWAPIPNWVLIIGIVLGASTFFLFFNKKDNFSIGTIDNATGVAQLYHLGLELAKNPLNKTKIILVATGAEELGDYGALNFLQENSFKLDPKTTKTIVVDSIGVKGTNVIISGIGLPVHHYSKQMEELAKKMVKNTLIPIKIQTIPPCLNVSGDIIVCDKFNYPTIWFTSTSFVFHTPKDTYAALDKALFFQILNFLKDFTLELDKKQFL